MVLAAVCARLQKCMCVPGESVSAHQIFNFVWELPPLSLDHAPAQLQSSSQGQQHLHLQRATAHVQNEAGFPAIQLCLCPGPSYEDVKAYVELQQRSEELLAGAASTLVATPQWLRSVSTGTLPGA